MSELDPDRSATERPPLLGLSIDELGTRLEPWVDKPYRVRQIHRAIYERAVGDFESMTDLSKPLRAQLAENVRIGLPDVVERNESADGTVKFLLRLDDGATIEAVDIPDGDRRTFCISSQAGCSLGCRFCVTGYWGAGRNLTVGEIVGQVLTIRRDRNLPPNGFNLVFMGMGEPLLNLDALQGALSILTEHLSWRRITVSTAGLVPGIDAMAAWPRRPNLAISFHAADDALRDRIMPINRKYPLAELMRSLREYPLEPSRKLTFEYILIRNVNDSLRQADALARALTGLQAKVNLIPINPDPVLGDDMVPPSEEKVDAFRDRLRRRGHVATVRRPRGDDVGAACGQLRAFGREPRGFPSRSKAGRS